MRKKIKHLKIKEDEDRSVKVRFETKSYVGDIIGTLTEVDDRKFKRVIKVAKSYRRANDAMWHVVESDGFNVTIRGDKYARLVNDLTGLDRRVFRDVLRNAKKLRRTLAALDRNIAEQTRLDSEDRERRGLAYE